MEASDGGRHRESAKRDKSGAHATVAFLKATTAPRRTSSVPGTKQVPAADQARGCSLSVHKQYDGGVTVQSTAPSRNTVSQNNHVSGGSGKQRPAEGTSHEERDNSDTDGHTQQSRTLASRSYSQSEISTATFALHHDRAEDDGAKAGQVHRNLKAVEIPVSTAGRPAFSDSACVSRNPYHRNTSATAAVIASTKAETEIPSVAHGEMSTDPRKIATEAERRMQPSRQQVRLLSTETGSLCHRSSDMPATAIVASGTTPVVCVEAELPGSGPRGASRSGKVAEAKVPSAEPAAGARAGRLLDTSIVAGDATTTDTRDSPSRGRRSARFLKEMLGASDKEQTGFSAGHAGDGGNTSSAARAANPLHRHIESRVSDSVSSSETNYTYGNGVSEMQSVTARGDGHAHHVGNVSRQGEHQRGIDSLAEGRSLASCRGELEWLCVPSLFYLFANIIKWNELQLQRRASQTPLEENHGHSSDASLSLVSTWSPNQEQELHALEGRIGFSVFELEGVYLNPFLVSWSEPKVRLLVADVASTWEKEGPYSTQFDCVSSRLFDAISTEQTCQLRSTCLFSVRQWLGCAQHRWAVACGWVALFIISILCIVFLAVFGRTQLIVCVVLSVTLSVAVALMQVVAVLLLHHNTYADTAARYFREEAVRAAQQKMEEEEMEEKREGENVSAYGHLGAVKVSRDVAGTGGRGYPTGDNNTDADDEYVEDGVSLAVRNLRALTEGNTRLDANAPPYYRLPGRPQGGKHRSGCAGSSLGDDVTVGHGNYASLATRSLEAGDTAEQAFEGDRENAVLLSRVTFEQQQPSHRVYEGMCAKPVLSPTKQVMPSSTSGATGAPARKSTADSWSSERQEQLTRGGRDGEKGVAQEQLSLQGLAEVPGNANVTAFLFCGNMSVLSQVALALWEHNFMLSRARNLQALDSTFRHGSARFKVMLIHAADVPEGSAALEMALSWLQVEGRPVFFFSSSPTAYPASVPLSARLLIPFSSTAFNALLLAGVGVDSALDCVSFPVLLEQEQQRQQQQPPSQPFQVPPYTLGRRLGGGAFGNVFEAEMEDTGVKCAVKRMYLKEDSSQDEEQQALQGSSGVAGACAGGVSLTGGSNSAAPPGAAGVEEEAGGVAATAGGSQLREIAQEVEIMSSLQHPNIVRYYYCERDDNCISIFMELCTGGSLSSLIHSGKLVNPPEIKQLLREIISAVSYLHNMRIVHRDLKPDNVLFRQGHIKITDFGTAVHKHGGDLRLIKGTFAYMAPEILVGEPYGRACDVWSIGCIAAEVLSVELPQHALGLPEMCEYYRAMGENSELLIACDVPGVRDFLLACLQRNPNARSTAAELFYHPILQPRDTSIHAWMVEVVARRRHTQQQQQAFHRNGLGSRAGGGLGSAGGNHQVISNAPSNNGALCCADARGSFDLHSDGESSPSLDSSKLTGQQSSPDSELTA
ncbi:hypothetical protein LSCM1_08274 [Leishmania martiniquensis]|uniref:Protein kinase domain-containing protein n=1 Tax=Leishmania martiniquensis TaxID=1580590 RepID=A0A836HAR5_9TRYP|nr:hypothetical protein LSCM1_08274 [Leishmania martiniquensis]